MTLVELDVFSGRPNPRWPLSKADARGLTALHRRLREVAAHDASPPALGYRGFLYQQGGIGWRAWNGLVIGADRTLADPERGVERFLASRMPPELAELRARIQRDLR